MAVMIRALTLLLPVLVPSWRFFAMVGPSPRIEVAVLASETATPQDWQEFRPRSATIPFPAMLQRLVWNPGWNEQLFLMSCAERFLGDEWQAGLDHILFHIRSDLQHAPHTREAAPYFQVRLIVVTRAADELVKEEVFRSPVHKVQTDETATP